MSTTTRKVPYRTWFPGLTLVWLITLPTAGIGAQTRNVAPSAIKLAPIGVPG